MKIFTSRYAVSTYLITQKSNRKTVGLVPTMGALHAGHLSLIQAARKKTDIVVCSIFVNPTQFNDPGDLARYPRPIESDIRQLEESGCDVLFLPEVSEMYSENEEWYIDLKGLDLVLEGKVRPGHYQGVTQIVKKLFDTISPDIAFFGQKDYQQFLVISEMVKQFELNLKVEMCPIVREADGLAMSSRNIHLSETEHQNALALNKALVQAKEKFASASVEEVKQEAEIFLRDAPGVNVEYFEICDSKTLMAKTTKGSNGLVALVAARVGNTRLIDNIILQ